MVVGGQQACIWQGLLSIWCLLALALIRWLFVSKWLSPFIHHYLCLFYYHCYVLFSVSIYCHPLYFIMNYYLWPLIYPTLIYASLLIQSPFKNQLSSSSNHDYDLLSSTIYNPFWSVTIYYHFLGSIIYCHRLSSIVIMIIIYHALYWSIVIYIVVIYYSELPILIIAFMGNMIYHYITMIITHDNDP